MGKKKIIFLTNPQEERKIIYKTNHADYEINKELGIGDYLVDLDDDITLGKGYKETIKNIQKELNEWYLTAIPSVLNARDEKGKIEFKDGGLWVTSKYGKSYYLNDYNRKTFDHYESNVGEIYKPIDNILCGKVEE